MIRLAKGQGYHIAFYGLVCSLSYSLRVITSDSAVLERRCYKKFNSLLFSRF